MVNNAPIQNNIDYSKINQKYLTYEKKPTLEVKKDVVEISAENTNKKTDTKEEKPKSKRSLIAKISIGAAGAIALLGVLTRARGFNKKVKEILGEKINKNSDHVLNMTKLKENVTLSKREGKILKISNFLNNTANIKDCYLLPFLNKFPILRGFAQKTSQMYTNTGVSMTQSAYRRANNAYSIFDNKLMEILKDVADDSVKTKIAQRNKIIAENFMAENVSTRAKEIENIMDNIGDRGIAVEVRDKFTSLIKKMFKEHDISGFGEFVAEDMVKTQKTSYINKLRENRDLILKSDDEIIDLLRSSVDEKTLNNLINAKTNAQKSLNNAIRTEGNDLFDKIRDVKIGSAPNDILGMLGTTGMLGVYLAQAEDKNQRVEAALTTGVPLGLGMLSTTFATMKMYTGMKAIAFGAVATFIANTIGKAINKEYQKHHNVKNQDLEIPTLDITFDKFMEKIAPKA